ncbi:MAG: hypothetical protein BGO49_26200 [Planctomycetales bacterium 71-10]|nr:MAG: hypothetical protein BGO49_26200 [Planctomycetales bacterium 71-10]
MIAVACDEDGVVALDVAESQRNDSPLAEAIRIEARDVVGVVVEALGDKQFDFDTVLDVVLDDLDALPVIPIRTNHRGTWPWDDVMRVIDKRRNRVERAFVEARQFRRFVTRYENIEDVYPGFASSFSDSSTSEYSLKLSTR